MTPNPWPDVESRKRAVWRGQNPNCRYELGHSDLPAGEHHWRWTRAPFSSKRSRVPNIVINRISLDNQPAEGLYLLDNNPSKAMRYKREGLILILPDGINFSQ